MLSLQLAEDLPFWVWIWECEKNTDTLSQNHLCWPMGDRQMDGQMLQPPENEENLFSFNSLKI